MVTLDLDHMVQIEGGSCTGAIVLAAGTALLIPATGGWSVMLGAALLGAWNGQNVYDSCF